MSLQTEHDPKNEAEITYWNSTGGRRWVERQQSQDIVLGPILQVTLERAQPRQGERVAVSGKTFDVRRLLVEAEGRLVDRQTFNARLWPEVIVEDRNLTVHVSTLRKALGSDCIETVAKNGYRLAVPVHARSGQTSPESQRVQREAHYQLSQAERVPAMKALGLFERAVELDPCDAGALAGNGIQRI